MSADQLDLAVVGAGPAGMGAAAEARRLGLSVCLLDEQSQLGGQIYRNVTAAPADRLAILGPDYAAGRNLTDEFADSRAEYVGGATVWGVSRDGTVDYVADGRAAQLSAKYLVLATGAMERPFPIKGWTLPGAMGAGAAQILLKGSGALPTSPAVLVGCGPLLYLLAWQYVRAGVPIAAVVDTTNTADYARALPHLVKGAPAWRELAKGVGLLRSLRRHGVRTYAGATGLSIEGSRRVEGVGFTSRGKSYRIETPLVLLHQGVVPNAQLSWSLGVRHRWSSAQHCWSPVTDESGRLEDLPIYVCGDSRAIVGAKASEIQGRLAALAIAAQLGAAGDLLKRKAELRRRLESITSIRPFLDVLYAPKRSNRVPAADDVVVCRCEEVTSGDIRSFVDLGCQGPNQAKAFGRCGMGPCQGRFCGLTVTEIIAQARGVAPEAVGSYRIRPPIKPVTLDDFLDDDEALIGAFPEGE